MVALVAEEWASESCSINPAMVKSPALHCKNFHPPDGPRAGRTTSPSPSGLASCGRSGGQHTIDFVLEHRALFAHFHLGQLLHRRDEGLGPVNAAVDLVIFIRQPGE